MSSKQFGIVIVMLLGEAGLQAQMLTAPVLPGEMPAPIIRTEAMNENALVVGLRVSDDFDDNALNDIRNKQFNLLTRFEPHVGWTLSGLRTKWTLDYRPGFSLGYPISIYNSRSQLLDTRLELTLTKRLRLRIREDLLRSKSTFDQLQQSEFTLGASVFDRPNNSVLTATQENSEDGSADLTYALSYRSLVGTSAAFYRVNYSSLIDSRKLESTTSTGTHAFYTHHLTKDHWIGCDYNLQQLTSLLPYSRAFVQTMLYTDKFLIRSNITVSFFAGPQHSLTTSARLWLNGTEADTMEPNWSWAGGANYTWLAPRTSVLIGLSRRISDGGGLQGIVQLSNATAEVRRQLTKRSDGRLFVSADHNKPLVSGLAPLSSVSFAGSLSRSLTPRLSLEFQYWRVCESSFAAQASPYWADHNRLVMSLIYENKTPLKR